MKTSDFDYRLPKILIAQEPIFPRDRSKLMILDRKNQSISHDIFCNLSEYLLPNDVLVFNQSKVIPARLYGKKSTGGKVEILLLKKIIQKKWESWESLTHPGIREGEKINITPDLFLTVNKVNSDGTRTVIFNQQGKDFRRILGKIGRMPTQPYIKKPLKNPDWYQNFYAKFEGSAAAPTAGFHFTRRLFTKLGQRGIKKDFITLHVGLDTFQPVKEKNLEKHKMHSEWYMISQKTADNLNQWKKEGRRIFAVGTTTARALESCATNHQTIHAVNETTSLFIYPGYKFKFVDGLITNFHLPKSTLLALVSAFARKDFILKAYKEAIKKKYRFYSFGDGMLIL